MNVYKNKNVVVMGLGVFSGGVEVTRFLARKGARVLVTDMKDRKALAASVKALKGLPVRFRLGGHDAADLDGADLLIKSPAVPDTAPFYREALKRGIAVDTEMNTVMRLCKSPVVGITGSNGKTTTTALIGALLKKGKRPVRVGGNIGQSLVNRVERIPAKAWTVLELSSFQLDDLAAEKVSPHIAIVTNCTPNHLDRHGTMRAYSTAKKNILRFQKRTDVAVLNHDDPRVRSWHKITGGKVYYFSLKMAVSRGAWISGGSIMFRDARKTVTVGKAADLLLPGRHNLANALAAVTAARIAGISCRDIMRVLKTFKGVEHRLEMVRNVRGVRFYNDSIATTPESTIAALESFDNRPVLIAGGYDKKIPFDRMGRVIARRAGGVVLLGQTGPAIGRAITGRRVPPTVFVKNMRQAVREAQKMAAAGGTVLLSPACASYDMYNNFTERGLLFKKEVGNL